MRRSLAFAIAAFVTVYGLIGFGCGSRNIHRDRRGVARNGAFGRRGTVASTIGLPFITVGNKAGSGCNFDPGTNPTPGDSSQTDCTSAIQAALNASVASPYSVSQPAVVQFLSGTFKCWATGTTPTALTMPSPNQVIIGAGPLATTLNIQQVGSAATGATSGNAWSNPTAGTIYVVVTPGTETSGSAMTTGNAVQAYSGATGSQTTGIYQLGSADTVTVTWAGGTPTSINYGMPFLAFSMTYATSNLGPAKFKFSDFQINSNAYAWGTLLDFAASYQGSGTNAAGSQLYAAWKEGSKPGYLANLRTTGSTLVADIMGDGVEDAVFINPACTGNLRWCVPLGDVTIIQGISTSGVFLGQTVNLIGVAFNAPITIPNVSAAGDTVPAGGPCQLNFNGAYFNGVTGSPTILNNQSTRATVINIWGGFWKTQGTPTAWIVGNEATTTVYIAGGTNFAANTAATKLFNAAPAGVFLGGPITFGLSETAVGFFTNTQYANNAARAAAGYSNPQVSQQVSTAVALQTTSTPIATYPATLATGLYRVTINVNSIAAAQTGAITITYFDATSSATTTITLSTGVLGNGAGWSWCGLINALTGHTIAVAGSVTTNNDGLATCIIEAL